MSAGFQKYNFVFTAHNLGLTSTGRTKASFLLIVIKNMASREGDLE